MKYIENILTGYAKTFITLAVVGIGLASSCSEKDLSAQMDVITVISEIKLDLADTLPMLLGTDTLLAYSILPENPTNPAVKWTSSSDIIASVTPNGLVRANDLGMAVISVMPELGFGAVTTRVITVIDKIEFVTAIDFVNPVTQIYNGDKKQFKVAITPTNATFKKVKWSSSNTAIATVSESGIVTTLSVGKTTIKATAMDERAVSTTVEIDVIDAIAVSSVDITTTYEDEAMAVGEKLKLEITVLPENAAQHTLTWSSSDESVLTVDEQGLVTAVGPGAASITVLGPETDTPDVISFKVAVGLLKDVFIDGQTPLWIPQQSGKYEITNGVMNVSMLDATKLRADLKRMPGVTIDPKNYPFLAFKYTSPTGVRLTLDTSFGSLGNSFNKMTVSTDSPDGVPVLWTDLAAGEFGADKKKITDVTPLAIFQFKIADIPSVGWPSKEYDAYWIRTFKTKEEMDAFIKSGK